MTSRERLGPLQTQTGLALVQLGAVIRKEVQQTVRDRRMMFMLVFAPLVQTVVFGYAIDFTVSRVPTLVVDGDGSAQSREHARRFLADGTLAALGTVADTAAAQGRLDAGEAAAVVILPRSLGADLASGKPTQVQVLLDGTDPNRGTVAAGAAARYFGEVARELTQALAARAGLPAPAGVSVIPRIAFNPGLATPPYILPGVMAMLLLIATTIVTAMGLSREREMGTLEQVLVTPIRPLFLLAGKMVPYLFIGALDVLLVLGAGTTLFELPMHGQLWALALGTLLYLLVLLGIGLLISTVSKTQQQSFLGGFLFAMPAILLSGVMTPIRGMPTWLQAVTRINPLRYYAELTRMILLKGAGFSAVAAQLLWLVLFAALVFGLATLLMKKRLA